MARFDDEFHSEYEEHVLSPEEYTYSGHMVSAGEVAPTGHEYIPPGDEIPPHHTDDKDRKKKIFKHSMRTLTAQAAAAALGVVLVMDSYGYDLLGHDIFNDHYYVTVSVDPEPEPEPEPEPTPEPKPTVKTPEKERADKPDKAFPKLPNLEPNGYVPEYGVLNEQYIRLENYYGDSAWNDNGTSYITCTPGYWNVDPDLWWIDDQGLHMSDGSIKPSDEYVYRYGEHLPEDYISYWGVPIEDENGYLIWHVDEEKDMTETSSGGYYINKEPLRMPLPTGGIPGMTYDEANNTLTLENFNAKNACLNINLMGNGFKIKLKGNNYLGSMLVWGFYYGGSVTFTGDGKLTIDNGDGYGIRLKAEDSMSCIMIEPTVTLDINGHYGAILVQDTKADQGIYYLDGTVMEDYTDPDNVEIIRSFGPFAESYDYFDQYYSVKDKEDHRVRHLIFKPKEDRK